MPDNAPHVVLCWELGGGLGHLIKGAMLARRLLERDCAVSFAVRDLTGAHPLLPEDHYCLVQAPYFDGSLRGWGPPADYAELLLHAGWGEAGGLQARVRGWRGLFDALSADLVIADHAPTAILAARTQDIPCALWGHGFGVPTNPWPIFRTWEMAPASRLTQVRQLVLNTVNATLTHFACPALDATEQLLDTAANFLCTWPELDHYPNRGEADYCGPLWPNGIGDKPWTGEAGRARVFAYLRPNLHCLSEVLQALARLDAEVLVHLTKHDSQDIPAETRKRLRFTDRLIDINAIAEQASLVICSGTDTLHGMAVRGVPTLALPMNAEQRMGAERLATLGAGRYLVLQPGPATLTTLNDTLADLLSNPDYRAQTSRLRARYGDFDSNKALADIADRCLVLLGE